MDERLLLRIRVKSLASALDLAWPVHLQLPFAGINAPLAERAAPALDAIGERLRRNLKELDRHLAGGHPLPNCWSGYRAAVAGCMPYFEECLALRQGQLGRAAHLDQGICAVADHLLMELTQEADLGWRRFTILDAGESFARLSGVVRLRYAELSIWDMPVVAHELGHFAAPRLERHGMGVSGRPFQQLLDRVEGVQPAWLEEYFADAFGAVTMGPAYAYTSLLLRFDPQDAASIEATLDGTHPPATHRAVVMLDVLRRLDDHEEGAFGAALDCVETLWAGLVEGSGGGESPDAADRRELEDLGAMLFTMLRDTLPPGARHSAEREERVRRLSNLLMDDNSVLVAEPVDRVADVINAGWRARTDPALDGYARVRVSEQIDTLARGVAGRQLAGSASS